MLFSPQLAEWHAEIQDDPRGALRKIAAHMLRRESEGVQHEIIQQGQLLEETEGRNSLVARQVASLRDQGFYPSMLLHRFHRRFLYTNLVSDNPSLRADMDPLHKLLAWCASSNVFIHPALRLRRQVSAFRDHAFFVDRPIARHTPLIAVPERLLIGFLDADEEANKSTLLDVRREHEFAAANHGGGDGGEGTSSDSDICDFFFASLGQLVGDLVTALSSVLTDCRAPFAQSLHHSRTLINAPYLPEDVRFGTEDTNLADVLLQMVRNYINAGPLTGKVARSDLQWAVSVCLSHSTPMSIAFRRSIGIVPLVHLFPHGGTQTNATVFGRLERKNSAAHIAKYFSEQHGIDLSTHDSSFFTARCSTPDPKWEASKRAQHAEEMQRLAGERAAQQGNFVYVVTLCDLAPGQDVFLQAMAPVCDKEEESEFMWRLSCGAKPDSSLPSSVAAELQQKTRCEIASVGGKWCLLHALSA